MDESDINNLPPMPWKLEGSSTTSANGSFHLYLVDAEGKKIAAIWGNDARKKALGAWLMEKASP